jgi:hypothetical protein
MAASRAARAVKRHREYDASRLKTATAPSAATHAGADMGADAPAGHTSSGEQRPGVVDPSGQNEPGGHAYSCAGEDGQ